MRFEVLGPLRVLVDGRDVTPSGGLLKLLLSLLLAHPERAVSADTLCDELWPTGDKTRSRAKLHLLVHRLRSVLETPECLEADQGGYRLNVPSDDLDSLAFTALAAELAAVGNDNAAVAALGRRCLELWRGTPFEAIDSPVLDAERDRLDALKLSLLERLYDAELELGRHAQVVSELAASAREHPLNERIQALAMTALVRCGRQAEALEAFNRTRQTLAAELGIDPSPTLQSHYEQILLASSPDADADSAAGPRALGSTSPRISSQLPLSPTRLVGRDAQIAELENRVAVATTGGGSRLGVITGTAGVGKTTLAAHWAQKHRNDFTDGTLFSDLRGFGTEAPADPSNVLASFIQALGGNTETLSDDVEERSAHYRRLVAERKMLIVLDNARSAEQVRPLLPGSESCLVLVTSRQSLAALAVRDDAQSISLDRLSVEDSLNLLARFAGDWIRDDGESARRIIGYCAELPLALRITAERLRMQKSRDLAAFAAAIADGAAGLDQLDTGDDPATDIRAVFSWSYDALPPDAAHIFRMIGLLPGMGGHVETIAAFADTDVRSARRALATLVRASLLEERADGRFHMHDLLGNYARELADAAPNGAEKSAASSRLLGYYVIAASCAMNLIDPAQWHRRPGVEPNGAAIPAMADADAATDWVDGELASMVTLAESAGDGDCRMVIDLAQMLDLHPWIRGHGDDMRRIHEAARICARALGDIGGEARAERVLAVAHVSQSDTAESAEHGARALALFIKAGDRIGEASALNNLAIVAEWRGEHRIAIDLSNKVLDLFRQERDRSKLSVALINSAGLLMDVGRPEAARLQYAESLELARSIGFQRAIEACLHGFARFHSAMNDLDSAHEAAAESLASALQSGDRHNGAHAHRELARVAQNRGNTKRALNHYDEALTIARATGDSALIADCLSATATLIASSNPAAALPLLDEAIALSEVNGMRARQTHARTAAANANDALGNAEAAIRERDRVWALEHDEDEDGITRLLRGALELSTSGASGAAVGARTVTR